MAEDRRFTTATATASGLSGIENYYNSYNKILTDSVILQTENGLSIRLTDLLKPDSKDKSLNSLTKEDFLDDVLIKNNGVVDEENCNLLQSLIRREFTAKAPQIVYNGQVVNVNKNLFSAQTCYLRIQGTNDTIDIRTLLIDKSKNKRLDEITIDDIDSQFKQDKNVRIYEPLVDLINGKSVDASEEIVIFYNGKHQKLDNATYVKEGVATESVNEVGKTSVSSAKREYYVAESTGTDKTPHYVESSEIIPPAYKKIDDNNTKSINHPDNLTKILNGEQIAVSGVISYRKPDGTLGYRNNQEVAMINGELFAVPHGYKVNPTDRTISDPAEHISKRVKLGEMKTSNVKGNITGSAVKVFNVDHDKYTVDLGNGVNRTISCYEHHFVIKKGDEEIVFGTEEYFNTSAKNSKTGRTTFKLKSFMVSFDPATNDFRLDISFVDNYIRNSNPPNNNSDELISSKLVADNNGNITQIKSVISKDGTERTIDLNNVFDINFNVSCDKSFVGNFDCYEPAPLFSPKKDASGNIIYKKDDAGNDLKDANGNPIPEEEVNADIIKTSKVNENGEFEAFDFAENDKKVVEFEENVKKLQDKLKNLQASSDKQANIDEIKRIKAELDVELEKIKEIRDKTSIKSINKIIEDYQNGEFFETFYFDKNGEMFEIKDGKKIALSSNTSADYDSLMLDLIGKYTVKNEKGKCKVVFGDKANNLIGGSLKVAEVLYAASLAPGIGSLFVLPFALTIGTASLAFAGGVAIFNAVRNGIKQAQLNRLTPEKIKKKMDEKVASKTKQDIKKATKEYNAEVKRIKKYTLKEEEKATRLEEAEKKFKAQRAKIIGRLSLLDDITISSKFTLKDKKITLANIYGRAEWAKQTKNVKKGAKLDYDTKRATREAKIECEDIRDAKISLLDKTKPSYLKEKHLLNQQCKLEIQNRINNYKAQNGPIKAGLFRPTRIHYLKQTKEYKLASAEEKAKMRKECREAMKKAETIKEVSSTTMSSSKSPKTRSVLYKYIESHSPKDLPITPEDEAILLQDEEKRTVHIEDRELARTATTEAEKHYNNVAGFVKSVENANEVVTTQNPDDAKVSELIEDISSNLNDKVKQERDNIQQKRNHIEQKKSQGQSQKQARQDALNERNKKAKEHNDSMLKTILNNSASIQQIVQDNELVLYARVYNRENNMPFDLSDEEKISIFLDEMATQDEIGKQTYLDAMKNSKLFKTVYSDINAEKNEEIIKELKTADAEFNNLNEDSLLTVMATIYVKMAKKNGHSASIPSPKFSMKKKVSSGNIWDMPKYQKSEVQNIFLEKLKSLEIKDAIQLMNFIKNQKEYKDFVAKNSAPVNNTP